MVQSPLVSVTEKLTLYTKQSKRYPIWNSLGIQKHRKLVMFLIWQAHDTWEVYNNHCPFTDQAWKPPPYLNPYKKPPPYLNPYNNFHLTLTLSDLSRLAWYFLMAIDSLSLTCSNQDTVHRLRKHCSNFERLGWRWLAWAMSSMMSSWYLECVANALGIWGVVFCVVKQRWEITQEGEIEQCCVSK